MKEEQWRYQIKNNRLQLLIQPLIFLCFFASGTKSFAQGAFGQDSIQTFTLDQCISFAIEHQPILRAALMNEAITRASNLYNISGWLPQAGVSAGATHYFQLQTAYIPDLANPSAGPIKVQTGVKNIILPEFSATQTIFSPNLLYAATSAKLFVKQAQQATDSTQIGLIAAVSKSFYNILLTLEQINVLKEDTQRLAKNLSDTYHQLVGGIADKTDYKEAAIALNNSKVQLKLATENTAALFASLKQLMGFAPEQNMKISFDTMQMIRDISFDTAQQLQFERRIEYKELQTARQIQHKITTYNKLAFLPSISAVYNYIAELENNTASDIFSHSYPYSYAGLSLNLPLFTGLSRVAGIRRSELVEKQLNLAEENLKSSIFTEYSTALASYKGNLFDLYSMRDNISMAKDVYKVVELQYRQGVVPYLNVITAESNLITSEVNYLNALFQVLSSKIDIEKAMGLISAKKMTTR